MSTVARGTAYEHACLALLRSWLKMDIYRTGGAHDQGRDLCGWWSPHAIGEPRAQIAIAVAQPLRLRARLAGEARAKV